MAKGELFDTSEIQQCRRPLGQREKDSITREIVRKARYGIKHFYSLRETCGILHCSYDELMTIISLFKIDVILVRSAYKVPWWDLAGYILDKEDDLEDALNEYLRKIARRNTCRKQLAS